MMFKFSKEHFQQNLLGLAILIIVGFMCWPLAPKPSPTPVGIFLPTGSLPAAISASQVQVLEIMPPNAHILGTINTKLYYPELSLNQENQDMAASLNYAKTLAAEGGANGIVPTTIGTTGIANPLDGFIVQATAVHY